jgi:hypothetical protein
MADVLSRGAPDLRRPLPHSDLLFTCGLLLPLTFERLLKIIGDEMPLSPSKLDYAVQRSSQLREFPVLARWLAIACLVLVAAAATAQTAHFHSSDISGTETNCPLCLVLHSDVNVAPVVTLDFSLAKAVHLPLIPRTGPVVVLVVAALFSRPPPVV